MSRRNARPSRRPLVSSVNPLASSLFAAGVFADANYLASSAAAGVQGAYAGFWVFALVYVVARSGGSAFSVITSTQDPTGNLGWQLFTSTSGTQLNFSVGTGAANVASPTYSITAGDVGKVHGLLGIVDGANVRLYVDNVQVGAGTALGGFTASGAAHAIGRHPTATTVPCDKITVAGVSGGLGVPSAGEITALFAAAKSSKDIASIAGKTDHLWSIKRSMAGGAVPASIADQAGADALAKTGALALNTYAAPTFAW